MSVTDRAESARSAAEQLLGKPAVQRAIHDPGVRDNARVAYEEARSAFDRVQGSKSGVASSLLEDTKTQNALKGAGAAALAIATALHEGPVKEKKGHPILKLALLAIVGGVLALALSESLRNKVLDLLFGAEEEFDYVSTTAPPPAPSAPEAPAAATDAGEPAEAKAEAAADSAKDEAADAADAAKDAAKDVTGKAEDAAS